MAKQQTKTDKPNTKQSDTYTYSVGRRKRAVARVRLYTKDKKDDAIDITVNGQPVGQYFHNPIAKQTYAEPLELTKTKDKFRVTVKVVGSGLEAQLDAMKHGIARALVKIDEAHKKVLKAEGLLTRDAREKQSRMIGRGGRARAKKQSPKR